MTVELQEDETFEDGNYSVSLVTWANDDAIKIGNARVIIKDGLVTALIAVDDKVAEAYGIKLTLIKQNDRITGQSYHLVASSFEQEAK
jgi:hypothetical protein